MWGLVLRVIPTKIRALDELFLPKVVEQICDMPARAGVVTGVTGSGKSTRWRRWGSRELLRAEHIVTIEDPIEFLHRDKKVTSISARLAWIRHRLAQPRASLRQDPDGILVGEMRDLETISTALHAAEPAIWCSRRCTRWTRSNR